MNRLEFKIKNYTIKEINPNNRQEIEAVQKLRYKVFCEKLKWVDPPEKGKEYDRYDKYATIFGIFNSSGQLVACSRIITDNPLGFMFQNEFKEMYDPKLLRNLDLKKVAEISRVAIDPSIKGSILDGHKLSEYLYKIMYKWSRIHKKRYWIFCVTDKYLQNIQKFFPIPFYISEKSKEYQKGVVSRIVMIDLKEAENKVKSQLLKYQFLKLFKFFKK